MNGEYLRGEVYWVVGDTTLGCSRIGRPALIVSSDYGNARNDNVIVAWMTTHGRSMSVVPEVRFDDEMRRVGCNNLATLPKSRLGNYMGNLDEQEMSKIDRALGLALGIVEYEKSEDKPDDELLSLKTEADMWRRMYEKAMEMLVDTRVAADASRRKEVRMIPVVAAAAEEPAKPRVSEEPEEPKLVDINSCSEEKLRRLGCNASVARWIVLRRPHKSVEDLRNIPGLTNMGYNILKNKVCCIPLPEQEKPVVDKVNVNTATAQEIAAVLGCSISDAYAITACRKKRGRYMSIEELTEANRWSMKKVDRYREKLEV